jgi:transcription elongation factor Elf1
MNDVVYYDFCAECGSKDVVIENVNEHEGIVDLWCRSCGAAWSDYIEDIEKDYR